MLTRISKIGLSCLALLLVLVVVSNLQSVDEVAFYLRDALNFDREQVTPIDPKGPYDFCNQFAALNNAQRAVFLQKYLDKGGIDYQKLPVPNTGSNDIFVPFNVQGPLTIFSAHYDKLIDDPEYQGASDNSAAVCMLMAAAADLRQRPPSRPVGILFTSAEEIGMLGSQAFVEEARRTNLLIEEVINFDNIGRGGLSVRPSSIRPGFAFSLPFLGDWVYDGRVIRKGVSYPLANPIVSAELNRFVPIRIYDRMTSLSDGTVFEKAGIPAVNVSTDNMYYLDRTWHTYADRMELLDSRNLDSALRLVLDVAHSPRS